MSANACVVFYGLRFEVSPDEIEGLELRSDPRMLVARKAGLKHYWANFGSPGERYLLFIGANLAVLGPENSFELVLEAPDLQGILTATGLKLEASGLAGVPALYVQRLPDVQVGCE